MMPPNSQERIQHYWEWENYLMDKILPMQPTFTPKTYMAHWKNLIGYNYSEGILQSWGKMTWDGSGTYTRNNGMYIGAAIWNSEAGDGDAKIKTANHGQTCSV